jgi:tol-pal system protein YbgF
MKNILIVTLVAPLIFVGAVNVDAASKVERDLEEVKRRLASVEQSTSNRALADLQAELDSLRVEFQRLQGSIDDFDHNREQLHDLINLLRNEMEIKFTSFEKRLSELEKRPVTAMAPPPTTADPAAEYEAAIELIQKDGEFTRGRKALQGFRQKYPDHELAVNASYWIGEAYYGEKQFENAILQFQDILKKHPQHNKAAAAQLKQALAFQSLGDRDTARVLMRKVVENYPGSPEAKKAQERLKK